MDIFRTNVSPCRVAAHDLNFYSKYNDEVRKHEETKKALSKAIKLANILLDEVTLGEGRKSELQVT